jgi:spore germination protein YaaH
MISRVRTLSVFFLCLFGLFVPSAFVRADSTNVPHALLYVNGTKSAVDSLRLNAKAMDIVAPQTYASTATGKLLGVPNETILKIARDAGAHVMPLIVNQHFCQSCMHTFLQDETAQNRLIFAMIVEAKRRGYIGFQYDFEHMMASDRDLYSAFVARSAPLFHAAGLQFSVALAPQHSANFAQDYGAGSYENWTGAFDYAAIGRAADFVSVMAYDDSRSIGPAAALPWVKQVLDYTLARIPAEKVSLGIPFYTWVSRVKTGKLDHVVTYPAIAKLLASGKYEAKGWSEDLGISHVTYMKDNKRLVAWYEDQRSFELKLALVTEKNLRGFSAWALGQEDPLIWGSVIAMRARPLALMYTVPISR